MSQANVDLVRSLQPDGLDMVEVFSANPGGLVSEEEAELFTDDFEVRFRSSAAGEGRIEGRGPAGLAAIWHEWLTPWKSYRLDVERFIDVGDAVVVFARIEARTKRDDVLMRHEPAAVWSIREGKVAGITFYLDREEALEAAGSSEETAAKSE